MKSNGTCWVIIEWKNSNFLTLRNSVDIIERQFVITSEKALEEYKKGEPQDVTIKEVECFS